MVTEGMAELTMFMKQKVALIYGAGGPVGGAVARAFAREGAWLFLAGRSQEKLDACRCHPREGPPRQRCRRRCLDGRAVDAFVDATMEKAGSIDVSFNVIGTATCRSR
jgi:NADP-dependent 3-hydroxy acid dehydrogenase YdfG